MNEPLFMRPHFVCIVWGGVLLRTLFGKDIPGDTVGESWEISTHKKGASRVDGGALDGKTLPEAVGLIGPRLLGEGVGSFDLLVKLLDAREPLSVQVHPDDTYAAAHENGSLGKTEAWVVLHAEPGASLIYGINGTREQFVESIRGGHVSDALCTVPVNVGDVLYIPAGTVHAIGAGLVLYEVQQSSDVTYRVYDWDRLPARELHIEKAIDVVRQTNRDALPIPERRDYPCGSIIQYFANEYFALQRCSLESEAAIHTDGLSYAAVTALSNGCIGWGEGRREFTAGQSFVIPACLTRFTLSPCELLVAFPSVRASGNRWIPEV